jgi:hypothetical protein
MVRSLAFLDPVPKDSRRAGARRRTQARPSCALLKQLADSRRSARSGEGKRFCSNQLCRREASAWTSDVD